MRTRAEITPKVGVAHKISRSVVLNNRSTPLPSILDPPLYCISKSRYNIIFTSYAYVHSIRFGRFHTSTSLRSNQLESVLNAALLKTLLELVSSGLKVD